jgi:hypothetical protein
VQLLPVDALAPARSEVVFRPSPWGLVVLASLLACAAAVPAVLFALGLLSAWWLAASVPTLLLLAVVGPTVPRGFGRDRWLLRFRGDAIALKVRSIWNSDLPREDPVVALLSTDEVRAVRRHVTSAVLPGPSGESAIRVTSLEISLAHAETEELAALLARELETRRTGRTHVGDHPVTLPAPDAIRVVFSSQRTRVRPGLERALEVLSRRVHVAEPREHAHPALHEASARELEDLVLELAAGGDTVAACRVLSERYGWSGFKCERFVNELLGRDAAA